MRFTFLFCGLAAVQMPSLVIARNAMAGDIGSTNSSKKSSSIGPEIQTSVMGHYGLLSILTKSDSKIFPVVKEKQQYDDLASTNNVSPGEANSLQTETITSFIGIHTSITSASATIVQFAEMYVYQNCSIDNADGGEPAFGDGPVNTDINNVEDCANWCYSGGSDGSEAYLLFGVEYGSQCRCANEMNNQGSSDACNMSCLNSPEEICGGPGAANVYILSQYMTMSSPSLSVVPITSISDVSPFANVTSIHDSTIFVTTSGLEYVNTSASSPGSHIVSVSVTVSGSMRPSSSDALKSPTVTTITTTRTDGLYTSNPSIVSSSRSAPHAPLATFTDKPHCSKYYLDYAGDQSRIYCNASLQAPDLSTGPAEDFETCIAMCGEVNKRNIGTSCIAAQFYNGTSASSAVCALKMNTLSAPNSMVSWTSPSSTASFSTISEVGSRLSPIESDSKPATDITATPSSASKEPAAGAANVMQTSTILTNDGSTITVDGGEPAESTHSGDDSDLANPVGGTSPDSGSGSDADGPTDSNSDDSDDDDSGGSMKYTLGSDSNRLVDPNQGYERRIIGSPRKGDFRHSSYSYKIWNRLDPMSHATKSNNSNQFESQRKVDFRGRRRLADDSLVVLNAPFSFVALFMANADQSTPDDPIPAPPIPILDSSTTIVVANSTPIRSSIPVSVISAITNLHAGTMTITVISTISRHICPERAKNAMTIMSRTHEATSPTKESAMSTTILR